MKTSTVTLTPQAVQLAIASAATETDAVVAVYRMVYPQWDEIAKIGDDTLPWPECTCATWKAICAWFQQLTGRLNRERRYDKQVMPGGPWLQAGFRQNDNLNDWQVMPAPVTLNENRNLSCS